VQKIKPNAVEYNVFPTTRELAEYYSRFAGRWREWDWSIWAAIDDNPHWSTHEELLELWHSFFVERDQLQVELMLESACFSGYAHLVEDAVQRGARNWGNALVESAKQGHATILEYIHRKGAMDADFDWTSWTINKALLEASGRGYTYHVQYLVEHGATAFETAIDVAKFHGHNTLALWMRTKFWVFNDM
jgi:hypothetical protein